MHKLIVLTALMAAVFAASSGQRRRALFQLAPRRAVYHHMPMPPRQYIRPQYQRRVIPSYSMTVPGFGRQAGVYGNLPDGEYHSAYGTASIDGSDFSFDSNNDYMGIHAIG